MTLRESADQKPIADRSLRVGLIAPKRSSLKTTDAISAEFLRQGVIARRYPEGDRAALEEDCLLLIGSLGSLRKTAKFLERAASPLPMVIAWVSEPLPPENLRPWALRVGSKLTPSRLGITRCKVPLHLLTHPAFLLIHALGQPDFPHDGQSAGSLRFLIESLAWVQRGYSRGWINEVVVSTMQKVRYLESNGIKSTFVPVGQQPLFGHDLGIERDIDVLFIGNLKSRHRRRSLKHVFTALRNAGATVMVPDSPIHGEERTALVNRARIMLHLHNYKWDTPWMRWNLATANGAVIASETLSLPDPLIPGKDYLSAELDDLPGAILELLGDEPRRLRMLDNCRSTINDLMTQEGSIIKLIGLMEKHFAK